MGHVRQFDVCLGHYLEHRLRAIDRFSQLYVVDFIDFTFIDFPVFNVADIGVTCGFVLLVIGYLLATRKEGAHV